VGLPHADKRRIVFRHDRWNLIQGGTAQRFDHLLPMLITERRWTHDQYETWLYGALAAQLLPGDPSVSLG
jgi:hypothetical protein